MTPEQEQQLFDTIGSIKVDVNKLTGDVDTLTNNVDTLTSNVNKLTGDVEKSNDKFSNYQQVTQWVVQLAFSLIASATVIVIVSNVLNK